MTWARIVSDLAEIKFPTRPASDRYLRVVAVHFSSADGNIPPSETIAFLWRPTALDVSSATMTADWLLTPERGSLATDVGEGNAWVQFLAQKQKTG
jgi:hypothetical protein